MSVLNSVLVKQTSIAEMRTLAFGYNSLLRFHLSSTKKRDIKYMQCCYSVYCDPPAGAGAAED